MDVINNNISLTAGKCNGKELDKIMIAGAIVWEKDTPTVQGTFTIDTIGNTVATANWSDWSDAEGIASYKFICAWNDTQNIKEYTVVSTSGTGSLVMDALPQLTFFYCRIYLYDNDGNETAGTQISFTTTGVDTTAPSTPILISVLDQSTEVNINWSASTDNVGVTGYEINRRLDSGNWEILTNTGNVVSYDDTTASTGVNEYRVRAKDAALNYSAWSNIKSITL